MLYRRHSTLYASTLLACPRLAILYTLLFDHEDLISTTFSHGYMAWSGLVFPQAFTVSVLLMLYKYNWLLAVGLLFSVLDQVLATVGVFSLAWRDGVEYVPQFQRPVDLGASPPLFTSLFMYVRLVQLAASEGQLPSAAGRCRRVQDCGAGGRGRDVQSHAVHGVGHLVLLPRVLLHCLRVCEAAHSRAHVRGRALLGICSKGDELRIASG